MNENLILRAILLTWFTLGLGVSLALFIIPAPYGRYASRRYKLSLPSNLGWVIMESPAVFVFGAMYLIGSRSHTLTAFVFLLMWMSHYLQRAFMYPFLQRSQRRLPLLIVALGFGFNVINAYVNGRYLFEFSGGHGDIWLSDPRFALGMLIFAVGYVVNKHSDAILRNLRAPGESGYAIPHGGLYRWVSCPNYFGEILTWLGWAVATWSLPGLAFALWTIANLAPRAWSHHRWYRSEFEDYPPERRALLPGVW